KNPRGCSMDLFSYLPYTSLSLGAQLPEGWSLKEWSTLDLAKLDRFYNNYSGGLLLDALGLGQECSGDEPLEETYSRLGFLRKWGVYCLKHKRKLNAVLVADQSDLAFNLSELLNSIKILVTNPEDLPWNVLSIAISQLAGIYHMDRVPILFYPFDYVTARKIPYEKQYQLWVLNVQHGNEYLEYMKKKFGIRYE
ncbi:MAG: PilZ domain-containing protein, partial [Desulfatiglandales bacterium]